MLRLRLLTGTAPRVPDSLKNPKWVLLPAIRNEGAR